MKKVILVASIILNLILAGDIVWPHIKQVFNHQEKWNTVYWQHQDSEFKFLAKSQPRATVFVGDSIIDGFLVEEYFPDTLVLNRGISGDDTSGVLNRIKESIIDITPKQVILMIGTNDQLYGKSGVETIENYTSILSTIKAGSPSTKVLVQSILPTGQKSSSNAYLSKLNSQIKSLAEENGYIYINLWNDFLDSEGNLDTRYSKDGLHLNALGYLKWAEKLKPYLD